MAITKKNLGKKTEAQTGKLEKKDYKEILK